MHEHEQWEPKKIHYDYYSGEPLDEDLYQKGRDDELRAMQDYGVYIEIPIKEAVGGKHIRGFPTAHMKEGRVRWRFVATEVNTEFREDNQQGTPPLMIVRATISRASSCPTATGVHMRIIRAWDVRKAFFNADLNEVIYVHLAAKRLRLKAFRLNKETTEEMTATKYCEWSKIEQHCATLNLRFPVKGLSSLMVAGFPVHCANADVEAVSGEAGLNAVNPVTDSQDWQSIPIVSLVLLLAMLMSFGLDCCCDWFSVVCRG